MINAVLLTIYGLSTAGVFLVAENRFLAHISNVIDRVRRPASSKLPTSLYREQETISVDPTPVKTTVLSCKPLPLRHVPSPVVPAPIPVPVPAREASTIDRRYRSHFRRANNWLQSIQYIPVNDKAEQSATSLFTLPLAEYIVTVDCITGTDLPQQPPLPFVKQKRLRELLLDDEFAALFFTGSDEIPQA